MKRILMAMVTMVAFAVTAEEEESFLYWLVDVEDGTAGQFAYDNVRVRAYETSAGVGADGDYLTIYYANGNEAGKSVSMGAATSGLALYAALASSAGPAYTYVVELFNDTTRVGQSESIVFTDAMARNYVATVTSTGSFPAMAAWAAGGYGAVPEPNSSLLVLLGCAALGLRRKGLRV